MRPRSTWAWLAPPLTTLAIVDTDPEGKTFSECYNDFGADLTLTGCP